MHYQIHPSEEVKIVQCIRGAIHDVIIDLRPDSPSYTQCFSVELNAENRFMLYIPQMFAHGFQTLDDNTDVFYQISEFYAPEQTRSVRWNDPLFNIQWPDSNPTLSERDRNVPDFVL
jgi:dTDP-4-dehydrorhamnose 3,5-epimerase